jgi:hypothetical protein
MSTPPIVIKLTTPPTRNAMGGIYGAGQDSPHAREKFVDGIGNLNVAVNQLQTVLGISTDNTQSVTGLLNLVNGNLSFGNLSTGHDQGNLKTQLLQGTSPAIANTPFTLTHTLGKIPNGFVVVQKGAVADFIGTASGNAWSTTTITIICNAISVFYTILVL